jgi:DNA-binding transcriptional ArsR family regulator
MTDVFQAVADPVRRHLIENLAAGEQPAGTLADRARTEFGLSQPAVSKHLRVLREAGVVRCRVDGPRRHYRLHREALEEVAGWVERQTRFWHDRLDGLSEMLGGSPDGPAPDGPEERHGRGGNRGDAG